MEFIKKDVSLWKINGKPINIEKLNEILENVNLMKGAKKCINILKSNKIKTAIVSAGLNILAEKVGRALKIDYVYSNGVKIDDQGYLTDIGIVKVKLMYKDEAVKKIAKQLDIPLKRIATVGNSCFDIPMFELSGLSIAFSPEDNCIKEKADFVVEGRDLYEIIPYFEKYIK